MYVSTMRERGAYLYKLLKHFFICTYFFADKHQQIIFLIWKNYFHGAEQKVAKFFAVCFYLHCIVGEHKKVVEIWQLVHYLLIMFEEL